MLKAGIGKVRITPSVGVPLAGFAARKDVSQGTHDELYARALVLENGETALALVSVDLLALPAEFVERVRGTVAQRTPVNSGAILIASTHTHAGPVTISTFFNPDETVDPQYMEGLAEAIAESVVSAWQSRFDARAGVGSGHIQGLAVNRRSADRQPVDEEVGIVRVDDTGGRTRAVLMNYSCHPTVLGPDNLLVTGDFPAAALERVESALNAGAFAMFVNGTQGDISVGHSSELSAIGVITPGRTFERAAELGRRLGDAVLEALNGIVTSGDLRLGWQILSVDLPLKRYSSPEEIERAIREAEDKVKRLESHPASAEYRQSKSELLYCSITRFYAQEAAKFPNGGRPIRLQGLSIGNAVFVAVPAEVFVEIGLRVKQSAPQRTFMIGIANGYIGYLPSRLAHESGGYEVVSSGCAPEAEDRLVEGVMELERRLAGQ